MAQVVLANQKSDATFDGWFAFWVFTRALLAAGWKYKGSGDATAGGTKNTDGNWLLDKWGVQGGINLLATVQSSTGPNITANTDGTATVTFAGTTFTANSVGRYLTIAGCANAGNNGTWRITTFTSGTSIKVFTGASAVTENLSTATWAEKHGGATGTISTVSTGSATRTRAIFTVSAGTPFVAPTSSSRGSVGDRLTVIGGAVSANNGTFMITRVISTTSVEIDNSAALATGETNNGTLSWVQCSPTQQTYPASITNVNVGVGAWINLQGPSTLKIPIAGNVPSAAFIRGELVTQTTSGATGTLVGCMTDTGTNIGHLVIEPRIPGTGGGVRGWTTGGTDTVTGALSGTTVTTANLTTVEFVRELVIWKAWAAQGTFQNHMWVQTVDAAAESASRYSGLATAAAVTNVIAPGGATATFPAAGSYVLFGTGSSNAAGTGAGNPFGLNWASQNGGGSVHVLCATCIENAAESADGSWTLMQGIMLQNGTQVPDTYALMGFHHMEGSEDGDLDPYAHTILFNGSYTGARTANVTSITVASTMNAPSSFGGGNTHARGWRRRGFASADAFQDFQVCELVGASGVVAVAQTVVNPCKVSCHPNPNLQIREALHIVSTQSGQKMRKGYSRWWFWTEGGRCNSLHANGTYVQAGTTMAAGTPGCLVVGPWDGVTIPSCAI